VPARYGTPKILQLWYSFDKDSDTHNPIDQSQINEFRYDLRTSGFFTIRASVSHSKHRNFEQKWRSRCVKWEKKGFTDNLTFWSSWDSCSRGPAPTMPHTTFRKWLAVPSSSHV
jgi:hypothetical protein